MNECKNCKWSIRTNSVSDAVLYCTWGDKHKLPQYTQSSSAVVLGSDGKDCECFENLELVL
jgi:hypothetical protein